MLLSNPEVARFVSSEVVPCWESVRPVPQVTVDFGDGQVLRRTLAGNTVLYLCLPDGRVLDAWPGVYTPADFLPAAQAAVAFLRESGPRPSDGALRAWHRAKVEQAVLAETRRVTISKAVVERPLLAAIAGGFSTVVPRAGVAQPPLPEGTDLDAAFTRLAARLEDVSKLPATAEQLHAEAVGSGASPTATPAELGARAVAEDSATNLRLVRPAVHLYFAARDPVPAPRDCRDVIYKQILHVPVDDPYLGLKAALVPGSP